MKVLGLDLSSHCIGYSIVDENEELLLANCIELKKFKTKKFPLEYVLITFDELFKIVKDNNPDKIIIEATYNFNVSTLKSLCRIRGIAEIACIKAGSRGIIEVNAMTARKSVFGNGKLQKEELYNLLKEKYPDKNIFNDGFDISDSIVLSLFGHKETVIKKKKSPKKKKDKNVKNKSTSTSE